MFKKSLILFVLFSLMLAAVHTTASSEGESEVAKCDETKRVELSNGSHYLINVPGGFTPDETWGVLLMLHGESSNDTLLNAYLYGCDDQRSFLRLNKLIGVAPHCKKESWGKQESTAMLALLDVLTKYKVDKKRIHLSGTAAGGFFAGWLGYNRADIFCTITIIAASLSLADKDSLKKHTNRPVYFILGETDRNLMLAKKHFKKIVKRGNEYARLSILAGQGHRVKFWDDFVNLGRYYKAVESGFDYPTHLKKARDNAKTNTFLAIKLAEKISEQPEEDVFYRQLIEVKELINGAGEKILKETLKRFREDTEELLEKLIIFKAMFKDYPVSNKAMLEITRLENQVEKKVQED